MSEKKHTPGPWKWDGDSLWHFGSGYERYDGDQPDPHRYTGIDANKKLWASPILAANKALIAAAPDLLAVCQELVESAAYWSEYDVPLGIVDRLKAAISKAVPQ